jgi:hypothetical protein
MIIPDNRLCRHILINRANGEPGRNRRRHCTERHERAQGVEARPLRA